MSSPLPARLKRHVLAGPPPDEARGVRWLGVLYPFEVYTLLLVGGTVLFLRAQGLRIDWHTVEYTIYPMVPLLPRALVGGIVLQGLYQLVTRRSLRAYLARVTTLEWLGLWLRMWFAAMLMTYAYFWLKISVPLINYHLWDRELWDLDVLLHGGISPSILVSQVFRDLPLLPLLDAWYGVWVDTVFYALAFFSALPEALPRRRFITSAVLLWTVGSWLYLALPAVGPIYAFFDVWKDLVEQMPSARGAQVRLWANYQRVVAGRSGVLRQFNPTLGVAAFPSLHVAAHCLFTLWARRAARPLLVPFLLGTFLTVIGSILTGWHYAVDAYAGLLLAWICFRLAILGEPAAKEPSEDGEDREEPAVGEEPSPAQR